MEAVKYKENKVVDLSKCLCILMFLHIYSNKTNKKLHLIIVNKTVLYKTIFDYSYFATVIILFLQFTQFPLHQI